MAAIHALPVELLTRVFLHGMGDRPYPELPPLNTPAFEVLVSHVCHHWRDVALRTQSLWTTLHFRLKCHMERAEVYLRRNIRNQLDILVDTCAEDEYEPGYNLFRTEFMPVFEIFTPHVDRWRSFSLKVRDSVCKAGARQALSACGSARSLEYLQLWHIEDWDSAERLYTQIGPPPVVIFNKMLPALKHLSLTGVNVPWLHVLFLEDLTSIDFALHSEDVRIPYDIWARMLETSPSLEKLSLYYSGPRAVGYWPETVISLPGLKELSLTDMDPPYLGEVFRRLWAPRVSHLRLELPEQESGQDFSAFLYMLAFPKHTPPANAKCKTATAAAGQMFPQLQTLAVYALECSVTSFRELLQVSSTVTRLELDGERLSEGLFEELFYTADPAPAAVVLLPELHTFRISGLSSASLIKFIMFRRMHGRPIKRWEISEKIRDTDLEKIAQDMQDGIEDERIDWFKSDDDEDEEETDEDGDEDEEGYDDGKIELSADSSAPDEQKIADDDKPVDYSEEEEEE
jgi:hypothetical protein